MKDIPIREISEPQIVDSGGTWDGDGMIWRLKDGVMLPPWQAMIMSRNFAKATGKNLWKYRAGKFFGPPGVPLFDESDGLHSHITVRNAILDCNARGGAVGGGLHLYGKGMKVHDFDVIDCHPGRYAVRSEFGHPTANANAWQGDGLYRYWNQVESIFERIRVNGGNILFQGAHDSALDNIFIAFGKMVIDNIPGQCSGLGAKLGTIHIYPSASLTIKAWGCYGGRFYIDTPDNENIGPGLDLQAGDCCFELVKVTKHKGPLPAVEISGHNNIIQTLFYQHAQNPQLMALKITGDRNQVLHGAIFNNAQTNIKPTSTYGGESYAF